MVFNVSHQGSPPNSQHETASSGWALAAASLLGVIALVGLVKLVRLRISSNS
jgi:hypothetical protein